jgi:hypothetical protein
MILEETPTTEQKSEHEHNDEANDNITITITPEEVEQKLTELNALLQASIEVFN